MKATPSSDTKTLLLDAAERLFAEKGIEGTSLRDITGAASANLAAVNYHFGSKDGLVRALFSRRLAPVTEHRLRLLDAAMGRKRPRLHEIVDALVTPVVDMFVADPSGGRDFAMIVGRSLSNPQPAIAPIMEDELGETVRRFLEAVAVALPDVDRVEVFWRFHFSVGVMNHLLSCGHVLEWLSGGCCDLQDREGIRRRLVDYIVGGLRSPASTVAKKAVRKI